MDLFISRKRRRISEPEPPTASSEEESTDFKLALLASLYPDLGEEILLEALLAEGGDVEKAGETLKWDEQRRRREGQSPRKKFAPAKNGIGHQSSLLAFHVPKEGDKEGQADSQAKVASKKKALTQKGKTLYLFDPRDIEMHTPCSIIHNFLPRELADALLTELVEEAPTFWRDEFQMFGRVVTSPHSFCFYVDGWDEVQRQKTEYVYNGGAVKDVRPSLPQMRKASSLVQDAVNREIHRRIRDFYPGGKKLKHQSPDPWIPNTAFVNCYDGPSENVGYHTDELTYLGPRAIIGSLSLGVAREFRIRKIVAQDEDEKSKTDVADAQGQISIHLPHNSLLVMHAEMQEEWKHSIAPAKSIEPHPIAKNKRMNITYRCYKESLHPKYTPKCKCGVAAVLRCMMKKKDSRGRYMWMCHTSFQPGKEGCDFFQWAEFDDDGEPVWTSKKKEKRRQENQVVPDEIEPPKEKEVNDWFNQVDATRVYRPR